jgi:hypothetical protein
MVNDEYADVTCALYAMKARGEPHRSLVRDAEALRQRLLHVPGVKKVNIIGEQAERIFGESSHDPSFAKIVVLTEGEAAREAIKRRLRRRWPTVWRRRRAPSSYPF